MFFTTIAAVERNAQFAVSKKMSAQVLLSLVNANSAKPAKRVLVQRR
jgi:hypothetical protein